MRILISLMYDGTAYCGWQIQPQQNSVQGQITDAIKKLTGEDVSVFGSGRTDAGVHALMQTAHFDISKPFNIQKIAAGLNFYLPDDIRITSAKKVKSTFHARFDCKRKTYIYRAYVARIDNPLLKNRALRTEKLDINLVKEAAKLLEGTHDFKAFCSSGSDTKTTVRTIYAVSAKQKNGGEIVFEVSANGFLYNMVRKIVAALISVGQGRRKVSDIAALLEPPHQQIKDIVPPHGLYLKKVYY